MRRLAALAVVLAVLALLVPSASAGGGAAVGATDPRGDGLGPGDLRAIRVAQDGGILRLRVRTEQPLNISTAPAWHRAGSRTSLRFTLNTRNSHPGPDYAIVLKRGPTEISTALIALGQSSPRDGCIPTLQTQDQLTQIEVAIAFSCFQGPFVQAVARYRLDQGGNGTIDADDRAPNAGVGPKLVPEA